MRLLAPCDLEAGAHAGSFMRQRAYAVSRALHCALSHRAIAATTCSCSATVSGRPDSIPCHFARHRRQHVAVACCATNTGCPRSGVCLPSLRGAAGASRWAMKSRAWSSTAISPFEARYWRSFGPSEKLLRNRDRASAVKRASRSRTRRVLVVLDRFVDRFEWAAEQGSQKRAIRVVFPCWGLARLDEPVSPNCFEANPQTIRDASGPRRSLKCSFDAPPLHAWPRRPI